MTDPQVLIEDWLPIPELSVENQRERGASNALPPLYFLHVWWARRPLMASRAAILASTLPDWSEEWPDKLASTFPTETAYRNWFLEHIGIRGDPVAAHNRVLAASASGTRIQNPYDGPRAFGVTPNETNFDLQHQLLEFAWGTGDVVVADPMAGGGSIPFESLRFGYRTLVGELNPVASVILKSTLEYPAHFGPEFRSHIDKWQRAWSQRLRDRLGPFFPQRQGESTLTYIFARTVACPDTGRPVPLSPNWWLRKGTDPVAVRLVCEQGDDYCGFEILRGAKAIGNYDPDEGTVSGGEGRSPWTGASLPADYIKSEARSGRMSEQLYAVVVEDGRGRRDFREPLEEDLLALEAAEKELERHWDDWLRADLIPTEEIPEGSKTIEPRAMGMSRWCDLFSPRQLLGAVMAVSTLKEIEREISVESGAAIGAACATYLALGLDKSLDYNSRMSVWHSSRGRVTNTFSQHNFSFKWSFAELNSVARGLGFDWVGEQIGKSYSGLAELLAPSRERLFPDSPEKASNLIGFYKGNAAHLPWDNASVHAVVVDPPYYDNVQYAELSDFFYVWEKRAIGHLYPAFFDTELSEKDAEAVANPARFVKLNKHKAKDLAKADYEKKMTACFREMHRVLKDNGVLTVMFTHKKVEAWDTLGRSLIEGGFVIEASWPIHTESEHSLHQAKKAAAASTILLVCRKRQEDAGESAWWEDLKGEVRTRARESAKGFQKAGITGVDLYIATFGPTLSVISRQWPVLTSEVDANTGEAQPLRPEEALDLAREEVASLRRQGLLLGRDMEFDPVTDYYLLAWDAFGAEQFPADEARKLALAMGLDLEGDLVSAKVLAKQGANASLQAPKARRRAGLADPEETTFVRMLDAAHALMVVYAEDGVKGAERFLSRSRLRSDGRFIALLQALINAIPRTKVKGAFARPEAGYLDALTILFPELEVPDEGAPEAGQPEMFEN